MRPIQTTALLAIVCSPSAWSQQAQPATLPDLTVHIDYSLEAHAELLRRKETVNVSAEIYGKPKPGVDPGPGGVLLARPPVVSIALDAPATFHGVRLDRKAQTRTIAGDPELLLNVYSGRKSSPDNLLACDPYQGPLEPALQHGITIHCNLISEDHH